MEALLHLWILVRGDHERESREEGVAMVIRQKLRLLGRFPGHFFRFLDLSRLIREMDTVSEFLASVSRCSSSGSR